jgi:hypothetical protein
VPLVWPFVSQCFRFSGARLVELPILVAQKLKIFSVLHVFWLRSSFIRPPKPEESQKNFKFFNGKDHTLQSVVLTTTSSGR